MTEVKTEAVAKATPPQTAWGVEGTSSKDLKVPRLALCQQISDIVKKGGAKAGDMVNSDTGAMIAPRGATVTFIPILSHREWLIDEVDGKKRKYVTRIPVTVDNENLPMKDVMDGKAIERTLQIHFFGLFRGKTDELPYVITFQKSSMKAGRVLSTAIQVAGFKGRPAAAQAFKIGSKQETRDSNDYYVFTVEPDVDSKPEEIAAAWDWYQTLSAQRNQVLKLAAAPASAATALPPASMVGDDNEVPF